MTACIVGWSHLPFGKREGDDAESMIVKVAADALADAGLEPQDIDAVFLGHFHRGFEKRDFTASLVFQASDAFHFKPATRVDNPSPTDREATQHGVTQTPPQDRLGSDARTT